MSNWTESTVNVRKQLLVIDMYTTREILTLSRFSYYAKVGKHRERRRCDGESLNLPLDLEMVVQICNEGE